MQVRVFGVCVCDGGNVDVRIVVAKDARDEGAHILLRGIVRGEYHTA